MLGKKCYDLIPCPRCKTAQCPLTLILEGEEYVEHEFEKEDNDGIRVPYLITAVPFIGLEGELKGIVKNVKDISELKRNERILIENELRFRTLFNISDDLVFVFNMMDEKTP